MTIDGIEAINLHTIDANAKTTQCKARRLVLVFKPATRHALHQGRSSV
jgi:hypothetical protein